MQEFKHLLGADLNKRNISMFVDAYDRRADITAELPKLKCDAILLVGSKTSHIAAAEHMHGNMDKVLNNYMVVW